MFEPLSFEITVALAIILVLLLIMILRQRYVNQLTHSQFDEQRLKHWEQMQSFDESLNQLGLKLKAQHSEHKAAIKTLTEHIAALEKSVSKLTAEQRELQLRDPEIKLYQQAKQLIAAGASLDEVVETCGIPRAEAELLISLQNN